MWLSVLLFLPALGSFFSADDWFHLRVSQISSLREFLNFFSFSQTPQSIAFYRPLPTQVFFFVFQKLFGFNSLPYHIFVLACFTLSLFLIYKLAIKLLGSKKKAFLTILIYGFSVSNFTRLYFLSAFQEISLVIFSLLAILSYLKGKKVIPLVFFILALFSKETAIVIPIILFLIDWSQKKVNLKKLFPLAFILLPYLYLRLFQFGGIVGETYIWSLSPIKAANTLMWYVLWSIGAPELLVDYIGSGLRPIPRFFTDYPIWWIVILGLLIPTIMSLVYLLIKSIKKIDRKLISFVILFIVSLGPVIFLPQHKFALELGLPLVWFSLAVAWLQPIKGISVKAFLVLYLCLNLSMNYLTYTRHYSVQRGLISKKIFDYVIKNYPQEPTNSYFEFINDSTAYTKEWGSSRQMFNTIGGPELFRVIYHDPNYKVYFEDIKEERPTDKTKITLSTKMFLQ